MPKPEGGREGGRGPGLPFYVLRVQENQGYLYNENPLNPILHIRTANQHDPDLPNLKGAAFQVLPALKYKMSKRYAKRKAQIEKFLAKEQKKKPVRRCVARLICSPSCAQNTFFFLVLERRRGHVGRRGQRAQAARSRRRGREAGQHHRAGAHAPEARHVRPRCAASPQHDQHVSPREHRGCGIRRRPGHAHWRAIQLEQAYVPLFFFR